MLPKRVILASKFLASKTDFGIGPGTGIGIGTEGKLSDNPKSTTRAKTAVRTYQCDRPCLTSSVILLILPMYSAARAPKLPLAVR